jgi:hypothetical protein
MTSGCDFDTMEGREGFSIIDKLALSRVQKVVN